MLFFAENQFFEVAAGFMVRRVRGPSRTDRLAGNVAGYGDGGGPRRAPLSRARPAPAARAGAKPIPLSAGLAAQIPPELQ